MKIDVTSCCKKATFSEDYRTNMRDHHDPIAIYVCSECKQECEIEEVCQFCFGTGEINYPAENRGGEIVEPDSRPCVCQNRDEDDFSGATEGDR